MSLRHKHTLQIAFGQATYTATIHSLFQIHTVILATTDSFTPSAANFGGALDLLISENLGEPFHRQRRRIVEDARGVWPDSIMDGPFVTTTMDDSVTYGDKVIAASGLLMWP